jgi:hypothetical protein
MDASSTRLCSIPISAKPEANPGGGSVIGTFFRFGGRSQGTILAHFRILPNFGVPWPGDATGETAETPQRFSDDQASFSNPILPHINAVRAAECLPGRFVGYVRCSFTPRPS